MKSNVDMILKMVEDEKITADEAVKLLNSLNSAKNDFTDEVEDEFEEECSNEKENTSEQIKKEIEDGFKKLEESFKKLEPTIEKTVKDTLLKVSELTKNLAEKFESSNFDEDKEEN